MIDRANNAAQVAWRALTGPKLGAPNSANTLRAAARRALLLAYRGDVPLYLHGSRRVVAKTQKVLAIGSGGGGGSGGGTGLQVSLQLTDQGIALGAQPAAHFTAPAASKSPSCLLWVASPLGVCTMMCPVHMGSSLGQPSKVVLSQAALGARAAHDGRLVGLDGRRLLVAGCYVFE